jgi:chromatin remodeling complex protein RSC6
MAKKKTAAFGGYSINFKGCSDTLESVFGSQPIGPSEMTKKIWAYVKRKRLAKK